MSSSIPMEVLNCDQRIDFETSATWPQRSKLSLDPLQSWLQADAPWTFSLKQLSLKGCRLPAQKVLEDESNPIPALFRQIQYYEPAGSVPRALTELDLSSTNVCDEFVLYILTNPTFANLKSLKLSDCRCLTDEIVEPLRIAFQPQQDSLHQQQHGYKSDVTVKLNDLDLTGSYLLGIDGLGDFWEDVDDEAA